MDIGIIWILEFIKFKYVKCDELVIFVLIMKWKLFYLFYVVIEKY